METKKAENILKEATGIDADLKALAGEVDYNFYAFAKGGEEYTIKFSRDLLDPLTLDFHLSLLNHLDQKDFPFDIPSILNIGESHFKNIIDEEEERSLRVHRWVPGKILDDVNPRSDTLFSSWGKCAGSLSKSLHDFNHSAANKAYKWNPSLCLDSKVYVQYMDAEKKALAEYYFNYFETNILTKLSGLRKGVNHNDLHEQNLLVSKNHHGEYEVTGIIDFGDAIYCEVVNELAIACAYAGMGSIDPLSHMTQLVAGYHQVYPIKEAELEVLFGLIIARLLITVCNAANNARIEPENEYLQVSADPAWTILEKFKTIHPEFAEAFFRNACGMEALSKRLIYDQWLGQNLDKIQAPMDLSQDKVECLDLSIGSKFLGNNANFESRGSFKKCIERGLEDMGASAGIGGYLECRPIYEAGFFNSMGNEGRRWRTIHLGLDVWKKPGSMVSAPIDGRIHSFGFNPSEGDYGGVIILEHQVTEDLTFYTLYGHLSESSVQDKRVGDEIPQGQAFAELGNIHENGAWPSHLHFQVILNMFDEQGDFIGVAYPEEQEVWKSICPDPIKYFYPLSKDVSIAKRDKEEIYDQRKKMLGPNYSISYKDPLHIVRGYKQYLYSVDGRRFLDTVNNVAHVGHEHPEVVKAGQDQMSILNTNTRYLHGNIVSYAESLLNTFPEVLDKVFFTNSGSEANELALRMAKVYSNQNDIIAVEHGYHGNTGANVNISSYKFDGHGGAGKPSYTHLVSAPDVFRRKEKNIHEAAQVYAADFDAIIDDLHSLNRSPAAFIHESILSCGGQIVLPPNYLNLAYQKTRDAGGLCIADEVQVGFGRVGQHFWAFELQGVVPDIVTLGKPIGNGHPLAAVVTTKKVANAFDNGMEYFNTFGGNPVSCAIGHAVLNAIENESLQEHAYKMGEILKEGLLRLQSRYPIIGDVRGEGLFLGFELVKDVRNLEPAEEQATYLVNRMRALGVLMSTDGPLHNVIKIKPPMCIDESDVDYLLTCLDRVFQETEMNI